jgi:hypothetical protein
MNEDTFNLQIRKFLKKVTSQREIESAVRQAVADGKIDGGGKLRATVTLRVPEVGIEMNIEDDIALE